MNRTASRSRVSIYVVDDDPGIRTGVASLLVGLGHPIQAFASGREFLAAVEPGDQGCVLLDFRFHRDDEPEPAGHVNGLQVLDELRARGSRLQVLFLSDKGHLGHTRQAWQRGAVDWLPKPFSPADMLPLVEQCLRRATAIHDAMERWNSLTPAERAVAPWLAAGYTSKEIARILDVAYRTVDTHRAHIFDKTDRRNATALALWMRSFDLAPIPERTDAPSGDAS